jgi:hypothetical protein
MGMLLMLKEGGSLVIDTIGNLPLDEDLSLVGFGNLKFLLSDGTQDDIDNDGGEIPFLLSDGTADNLPLDGNKIKFLLSDGTQDDIDMV